MKLGKSKRLGFGAGAGGDAVVGGATVVILVDGVVGASVVELGVEVVVGATVVEFGGGVGVVGGVTVVEFGANVVSLPSPSTGAGVTYGNGPAPSIIRVVVAALVKASFNCS